MRNQGRGSEWRGRLGAGMGQGVERGLGKEVPELEEGLGGGGDSGRQRSGCHQGWGSEEKGA